VQSFGRAPLRALRELYRETLAELHAELYREPLVELCVELYREPLAEL